MNYQAFSTGNRTHDLVKSAIVIALYMALTFIVAPVAFGPIQFRISEILNYLGVYHKRYIYAVTLGVFLANSIQYGPVDMVVGSLTTLLSFYGSLWLGNKVIKLNKANKWFKIDNILIKYVTMAIIFALGCFTIALMLVLIGAEASFWVVYFSLFVSELIIMLLGIPVMYTVSKRVDLTK